MPKYQQQVHKSKSKLEQKSFRKMLNKMVDALRLYPDLRLRIKERFL